MGRQREKDYIEDMEVINIAMKARRDKMRMRVQYQTTKIEMKGLDKLCIWETKDDYVGFGKYLKEFRKLNVGITILVSVKGLISRGSVNDEIELILE